MWKECTGQTPESSIGHMRTTSMGGSHRLSHQASQWIPTFCCEGMIDTLPKKLATFPRVNFYTAMAWLTFPNKHTARKILLGVGGFP